MTEKSVSKSDAWFRREVNASVETGMMRTNANSDFVLQVLLRDMLKNS